MSLPISRRAYADMYGPTTGDRVRLGDTGLLLVRGSGDRLADYFEA